MADEILVKEQDAEIKAEPKQASSLLQNFYNWSVFGLSILILVFGWLLFVRPEAKKARELSRVDADQLQSSLEQKERELLRIKRLSNSLELLPQEIQERLVDALPTEPRAPDLLVVLDGLGQANALELLSTNISLDDDPISRTEPTTLDDKLAGVDRVALEATYEGASYTVLKSFLRSVESSLRLLQVNGFEFAPGTSKITFDLTSFYFSQ